MPLLRDHVVTDPQQVRDWDAATLARDGISSLELMERAARAFVDRFAKRHPLVDRERVDVLCGPGNNGGDGAAIARLLEALGYTTTVWGWWDGPEARSADLRANWQRLVDKGHPRIRVNEDYDFSARPQVIIDALFGVGLDRELRGAYADTVRTVNGDAPAGVDPEEWTGQRPVGVVVVSVDVPSGQRIDGTAPEWLCVDAHETVTFQAIKFGALLPDTGPAWGSVQLVDLELDTPAPVEKGGTGRLTRHDAYGLTGLRDRFTHKGTYGHVLVMAGSRGHAGAALLCGRGAYRSGCGLVTFFAPARLEGALQLGLPEAMVRCDPDDDRLTTVPDLSPYDAVVVGPGIGTDPRTAAVVRGVCEAAGERPVVFDADALNLIAADDSLLDRLPAYAILTPHPGEFYRLAGGSRHAHQRYDRLRAFAGGLPSDGAVVVLKGQYTAVCSRAGDLGFNFPAGNPGMATGGMGDVLAGAIAGCAAQLVRRMTTDLEREELAWAAASTAVLAHAHAGDLAAAALGQAGLLAGDVADRLGLGLREVRE